MNPGLPEWRINPAATGLRPVVYTLQGDEGYVRTTVLESNGDIAWTQPVMVARRSRAGMRSSRHPTNNRVSKDG